MRWTAFLLVAQAVITGATGLALFIAPDAIPSSFGMRLTPDAHLLCYFYGATELALCFASLAVMRSGDGRNLRPACTYFAMVHAAEGFAGALAVSQGISQQVLANCAAHAVIALLFILAASRPSATQSVRA